MLHYVNDLAFVENNLKMIKDFKIKMKSMK